MQKHVWYWVKRSGKWFWALRSSKALTRQIECGKRIAAGLNRMARPRLAAVRARARQLSRLARRLTTSAAAACSTIVAGAVSAAGAVELAFKVLEGPKRPAKHAALRGRRLVVETLEAKMPLSATGQFDPTLNASDLGHDATVTATSAIFYNPATTSYSTLGSSTDAVFSGTPGTASFSGTLEANSLRFEASTFTVAAATGGGSLSLPVASEIYVDGSASAAVTIAITAGGILKTGDGPLVLSGSSTFAGDVTVADGTIIATTAAALPDGANLNVGADMTPFAAGPPPATFVAYRAAPAGTRPTDAAPLISAETGVDLTTGAATQSADDGLGGSGPARLYDSQFRGSTGSLGRGWMLSDQPYVIGDSGQYRVVLGPETSYQFDYDADSGEYAGQNGILETLTATSGGQLAFAAQDGSVYLFNPTDAAGAGSLLNGQLISITSPGGATQVVTGTDATAADQISTMEWRVSPDAQAYRSESIGYLTSGINANHVQSIVEQGWDGSEMVNTTKVEYTFYDGSNPTYGWAGTLESAAHYVWDAGTSSWSFTGLDYYRYDLTTLALVISPQGAANAVAATVPDPTALDTDGTPLVLEAIRDVADLSTYATASYEYNELRAVSAASLFTADGLRQYQYSYGVDITLDFGPGIWSIRVTEVRPDSSSLSVFSNDAQEPLLTDLSDGSGNDWITAKTYNSAYQLTSTAAPSAIDMSYVSALGEHGYDSSDEDLGIHILTAAGLIENDVYSTTTSSGISDTTAGDVAGYLQEVTIQSGSSGTAIAQASYTYYARSGDVDAAIVSGGTTSTIAVAATIFPTASSTEYRNSDGTGAITTRYVDTWYSGTLQPFTIATVLPIVSTDQNGPGGTDGVNNWTTVAVFGPGGDEIWDKDASGNLALNQYDATTGLLMETVANVDTTALPSTISNAMDTVAVPLDASSDPLFATPSGDTTNLNAASDEEYDSLGRETLSLGPQFTDAAGDEVRSANFFAYLDTLQALPTGEGEGTGTTNYGTILATASGFYVATAATGSAYATGDYVVANPLSLSVANLDAQDTDDLQVQDGTGLTVTETTSAGALAELASAAASPTSESRWTHYDIATAADSSTGYAFGDIEDAKVYTDISTGAYDQTILGYDADGNVNVTRAPGGIITYIVIDPRGLTTSVWIGTDDNGATASDPSDGGTSPNDMQKIEGFVYDNNSDGGDGNLTTQTDYVTSTVTRTTALGYDWRDRQVSTMTYDGTYYTYVYTTYDNLDQAVMSQTYQAAAAWTVDPAGDTLLDESTTSYDDLGQVYQTVQYSAMPPSSSTAETTNYYRDGDGNTVGLLDPDSNETSWVYNALGSPLQQTTPLGTEYYQYNAANLLVQSTDADDRAIVYGYNGIGEEVSEKWFSSTDTSGSPTETIGYTFNSGGLLDTATDDNSAADSPTAAIDSYQYDDASHVTSETQQIPGLDPTVTLSDQYTNGGRTQLAANVGGTDDFVNNYQYAFDATTNPLGEMSQVTQSGDGGNAVADKTATFQWDQSSELTGLGRYQNGDATANLVAFAGYGYNSAGELTSLAYTDHYSATLDAYVWTYSPLGDIASSTNSFDGTVSYTSDAAGQYATSDNAPLNESYTLDANGNRETADNTNGSVTYVTGSGNRVLFDGSTHILTTARETRPPDGSPAPPARLKRSRVRATPTSRSTLGTTATGLPA